MSIESVLRFAQLGLSAPVLEAVEAVGYEVPSPIQAQSIPPLLDGRDLLGQAQTGTGKTAAFALPILSRIDLGLRPPQAIILTPTRELAIQVAEAVQAYARGLDGFHVLPIYGGQPIDTQLRHLRRGVHVVVGTPGRVLDHLRRGTLSLDAVRTFVIDEADEMLRMGFIDDVEAILEAAPDGKQVALFSATMPPRIRSIAQRHLDDAAEISIKSATSTVSTVQQHYCTVKGVHKLEALTRILETTDIDAMIVFVRTKAATMEVAEKLAARGYASAALNGDLNQPLRERTINRLKRGDLDIVVATDVAARGLDVERISHVINYDIPVDSESYVHRIGRTARAGRTGAAILFVSPRETRLLRMIEQATGQPIDAMKIPPLQAVTDRRIAKFKQLVRDTIASTDLGLFEELIADLATNDDLEPQQVAAALAYLAQQDRPLQGDGTELPEEQSGRGRRDERPERGGRPQHGGERRHGFEAGMTRYRIEVGHEQGVLPKHIVGAIANEAGLEGRDIGQIKIFDRFALVDLPEGMPREILQHLQGVIVCGVPLRMRADRGATNGHAPRPQQGGHGKPHKNGGGFRHPAQRDDRAPGAPRPAGAKGKPRDFGGNGSGKPAGQRPSGRPSGPSNGRSEARPNGRPNGKPSFKPGGKPPFKPQFKSGSGGRNGAASNGSGVSSHGSGGPGTTQGTRSGTRPGHGKPVGPRAGKKPGKPGHMRPKGPKKARTARR